MRKKTGILLIIISSGLIVFLLWKYLPIYIDYYKSLKLYSGIEDDYTKDPDDMDPEIEALLTGITHQKDEYGPIDVDGEALLKQNSDYIGWIYIPKTDISYPVVQSKDNADYLHTDFNKNYSFPGTIFLEYRCKKSFLDKHSILYGHNMNNGSMFAGIKSFRDQEYAEEHPVFWFITPDYKLLYQVFAVCSPSPTNSIHYGVYGEEYKDEKEFGEAIKKMKEDSVVKLDVDVDEKDRIMSLSTCTGNSSVRCIVHGVLVGNMD